MRELNPWSHWTFDEPLEKTQTKSKQERREPKVIAERTRIQCNKNPNYSSWTFTPRILLSSRSLWFCEASEKITEVENLCQGK